MKVKRFSARKASTLVCTAAALSAIYWASYAAYPLDDQPIASVGAMEFSNFKLSSNALAFRGDYIRSTWDGDLLGYDVSTAGSVAVKWRARTQLASVAWDTGRKIFTSNPSGTGVVFQWAAANALSTAQKTALGDSTTGPKILAYVRGDAVNERTPANPGGSFRQRNSRVGAVIHSRPYYYDHSTGTGTSASANSVKRVYVGANDGMLHAFDADTGNEVFAYVPSMLFSKLADLSIPSATTFKYYVDGLIAMAPVPKTDGSNWTLLAAGLGSGAKGIFALDVTNPTPATEAAAASMAKYEITEASVGFANLGHVFGAPQIVKLNNGITAVLVPNGVNSSSGVSSLFVINAASGALLAEISAGSGTDNGLGAIAAVDKDGNGTVDVVYAGDLKGTLWKFDLSSATLPSAATALFTPDTRTARPITAAPSVIDHPRGGFQVNFGTGQMLVSADLTSTANEYLYGIWDSSLATGTNLVQPTLTQQTVTVGSVSTSVRVASASVVDYSAGADKGWRITLSGGERLLAADTFSDSGRYVITSSVPNAGTTQGSWLLQIDALTGGRSSSPFFDLTGDGIVNANDTVTLSGSQVAPSGRFLGTGVWSQPVLAQLNRTQDLPFFNHNLNTAFPPTTTTTSTVSTPAPAGERGVYGGHFDFDIYYNVCNALTGTYRASCTSNTHVHEYDDKFNVVGVNMLNASNTSFNLVNAIAPTTTPFKLLIANTKWSPAAKLRVVRDDGAGATTTVSDYLWNLPLSADGFLAATPGGAALTFTRANLKTFTYFLPVTAFTNKEWRVGSGDVRAGLIPTVTGCVRDNIGGQGALAQGAWMNGALTIQVVKDTTPSGHVEATSPADAGGYRLKKSTVAQANQLAQYTSFWHHPNGKCLADAGWTKSPPSDSGSSTTSSTPAAGSTDPTGAFISGAYDDGSSTSGAGSSTTTTTMTYQATEVTATYTFDNNGATQVLRRKSDGVVIISTVSPFGSTSQASVQIGAVAKLGRLGWRELVR